MPRNDLVLASVPPDAPHPAESAGGPVSSVPLHSVEVEMSVLGAALIDEAAAAEVVARCREAHFRVGAHRKLLAALRTLLEASPPRPVMPTSVSEALRDAGDYDAAGGAAYLAQLWDYVPHTTPANLEYHLRRLFDLHTRRRVLEAGETLQAIALHEAGEAAALVDKAGAAVLALSEDADGAGGRSFATSRQVLGGYLETLQQRSDAGRAVTGVPSGWDDLDEKTAGFHAGELVIVAGRPGQGKTSAVLNIAAHVAIRERRSVAVFSLEMSAEALIERMLASEGRVDSTRLRNGRLTDYDYAQLSTAIGYVNTAPVYIDDTPALSVLQMRTKARRLKAEHPDLALIVVDYLQLMTSEGENRTIAVGNISRGLKALAKELDVPVVALSQLSRQVENRPDKRPLMSDLRESGAIEADADLILFLFRPEYYFGSIDKEGNNIEGLAEIIIGKQRNGATGTVTLRFLKEYTKFESFSNRTAP